MYEEAYQGVLDYLDKEEYQRFSEKYDECFSEELNCFHI